ncbi:MAG TPA: hypothetical protein VE031_02770 [Chthoniobacterales bacterium]|nr:hypothetical protein [Chthoniobacterales bacterium]
MHDLIATLDQQNAVENSMRRTGHLMLAGERRVTDVFEAADGRTRKPTSD